MSTRPQAFVHGMGLLLRRLLSFGFRIASVAAAFGCRPFPVPSPVAIESRADSVAKPSADPALATVEPGRWKDFAESRLVLALHEPIFYPATEDEQHPRLLAFADGRVLYRFEEDGIWQWYVARLDPDDVEALSRSVNRDLARTPRSFSCSAATHQRRSIIVVRYGARWRVREGYALSACLDDIEPDRVPSSSHPVPMPAPDRVPAGFVRAYRRLRDFRVDTAQPWYTPRISLVWIPDDGPSAPWPETLPGPPRLPARWDYHGVLAQPIDGRFDRALRTLVPLGVRFEIDGEPWGALVHREQPGDAAFECAWSRPSRRCGRSRAKK